MQTDNSIVQIVKKALPAVVSIAVVQELEDFEFPLKQPGKKSLKTKKEISPSLPSIVLGGGSGFIVDDNGIILTNRHVVTDPLGEYLVVMPNGQKIMAEILARDPIHDIAILKINPSAAISASPLPVIPLGDSLKAELGETVVAIGNALGMFRNTVSAGVVSGLSREIQAQNEITNESSKLRGLLQTDAAINPGNSGGPLLNLQGEAIGINAAMVSGAENIGFALPINNAKWALKELKQYGRIRQPYLGVRYLAIDSELKHQFGLPVSYGVLVMAEPEIKQARKQAVVPGSPAAKAGLKEADIILEIQGKKVTTEQTVNDILEMCHIGREIPVKILRDGREKILKIILGEKTI
ncbi:MAG: trypsin-like peptidase domain-containing protein [Candidatus Pacebacteria bacterium]|nr:trypsin-like peptidase domain-containing protein [Candidatus Paceibacterota bacterium]